VARFLGFFIQKSGEYIMAEEFRSDSTGSGCSNSEPAEPERVPVRVLIISTPEGVQETIHWFYEKGIARVDAWTPAQPAMNYPGEVVAMLVRYRHRKEGDRASGR
jgi:hypothetical protein